MSARAWRSFGSISRGVDSRVADRHGSRRCSRRAPEPPRSARATAPPRVTGGRRRRRRMSVPVPLVGDQAVEGRDADVGVVSHAATRTPQARASRACRRRRRRRPWPGPTGAPAAGRGEAIPHGGRVALDHLGEGVIDRFDKVIAGRQAVAAGGSSRCRVAAARYSWRGPARRGAKSAPPASRSRASIQSSGRSGWYWLPLMRGRASRSARWWTPARSRLLPSLSGR